MVAKLQERPIEVATLKGKVDIKWYGHSGFKISFKDNEDVVRSIYIDIWINNKNCPDEEKTAPPNDCDLCLVTHAQFDHSENAPMLMLAGKHEHRQIVCTEHIAVYLATRQTNPKFFTNLAPGSSKDFGWVKIHCVQADHPSTFVGPGNV